MVVNFRLTFYGTSEIKLKFSIFRGNRTKMMLNIIRMQTSAKQSEQMRVTSCQNLTTALIKKKLTRKGIDNVCKNERGRI